MIDKEAAVTCVSQDGECLIIFVAWTLFMFCVHGYREVFFFFFVLIHLCHRIALSDDNACGITFNRGTPPTSYECWAASSTVSTADT